MSSRTVWVGIHDHADAAPRWLDARVSYTWLRSFERACGVKPIAYLREPHYNHSLEAPVRGVYYRFRTEGLERWVPEIVAERPTLILYNICAYCEAVPAVEKLKEALPHAAHVARIHHQVKYLAAQRGFREFLLACDAAIAPSSGQVRDVYDLGFSGPVYDLPFGVDLGAMRDAAQDWRKRDIQLASAANGHPARNLQLVEAVYDNLRKRGRLVENFQGLDRRSLAEKLGRTKIFWQTSLTEASGSRILPEAMAAGCYPVTMRECVSTTELIQFHGTGAAIASGIRYDFSTKTSAYPQGIVAALTDALDSVIARVEAMADYAAPAVAEAYDEEREIARLSDILSEIQQRPPRLSAKRRAMMPLPVDDGGYAFNPAICRTEAGLLCVYRHVDRTGARTLRRLVLDDVFAARSAGVDSGDEGRGEGRDGGECGDSRESKENKKNKDRDEDSVSREHAAKAFYDWSDEMKAMGCPAEWHADPRIFSAGNRYFLTFNTGHSKIPNSIFLVEIDAQGRPLSPALPLVKPDGRREIEKNWGFFAHGGEIYAIYSISPFVVLKICCRAREAVAQPFVEHVWDASAYETRFGELRGGASPVILGERGLLVAQSSVATPDGRIYRGTALAFEACPPFRPLQFAEFPLFQLAAGERQCVPTNKLNPSIAECLYPSGAVAASHGGDVTISYGINDFRSGARTYALEDIERRFVPCKRKGG